MESLEELKAIIDNAPEGASHVDDTDTYWKVVSEFDYYFYNGSQWDDSESIQSGTRSLSDINRIIWQREMLELVWPVVKEAGYEDFCSELRNYMEGDL